MGASQKEMFSQGDCIGMTPFHCAWTYEIRIAFETSKDLSPALAAKTPGKLYC